MPIIKVEMQSISNISQFLNPSPLKLSRIFNYSAKRQSGIKSLNSFDKVDISPLWERSPDLDNRHQEMPPTLLAISESTIDFHLTFESRSMERLTADGYFSEETKKLDISFTYQFQQEVAENGAKELHTFEANLSLKIENIESTSVTPFKQKEDIMNFVSKLIGEIMKVIADDDKTLAGVIFDKEDLEELGKIKDGKLLKMILELVQMAITLAKFRQMIAENKDKELVLLHPEREETSGLHININQSRIAEFSLKIRDITQEIENDTEALESDSEELETAQAETS